VLYGATGGELFAAGAAGERFAVRNSGAVAVIEGVGDHGCEYMTGGTVVVLGPVGKNFAAGMTGGTAYVLDEAGKLAENLNRGAVQISAFTSEDEDALRQLVERHFALTHSRCAGLILEAWEQMIPFFWKVAAPALAMAKPEAVETPPDRLMAESGTQAQAVAEGA